MAIPNPDRASLSFRLHVLDPIAMSQHREAVMAHFSQFALAYDPGLSKGPLWQNVPFKAHHDWAVSQALNAGSYDPVAFQNAYALAASEVFFLFGVDTTNGWDTSSGTGLPHPAVGAWGPTPLEATANSSSDVVYIWEWDPNSQTWVRVCYSSFMLTDTSGSAPIIPTITIDGADVARVEASLTYGEDATLAS